jgi:hypothetical protein
MLASESGEVVTLTTLDAEGFPHPTRLWVVDRGGSEWVRTGNPDKGWYQRLQADPEVELERAGETHRCTAVPVRNPDVSRGVNEVFARKYGSADWIVALSGDASRRVVVRLDPRE